MPKYSHHNQYGGRLQAGRPGFYSRKEQEVKRPGPEADYSLQSNEVDTIGGVIHLFPHTSSWRGA
jgi:hypothetical protein